MAAQSNRARCCDVHPAPAAIGDRPRGPSRPGRPIAAADASHELGVVAFEILFTQAVATGQVPEAERAAWRGLYRIDPDAVLDLLAHHWTGGAAA